MDLICGLLFLNFYHSHTRVNVCKIIASVFFFSFYLYTEMSDRTSYNASDFVCMLFSLFPFFFALCVRVRCVHLSVNFDIFFFLNTFGSLNWKSLSRKSMSSDVLVCECDCRDNTMKFTYATKWIQSIYVSVISFLHSK